MNKPYSYWASIHIFLSDPAKNEAFLVDYLPSFARDLVKAGRAKYWFFMRYWEGGPHIRFRFLTSSRQEEQAVVELIRNNISVWKAKVALDKESYYANHTFDGSSIPVEELPWYPDGSVEAIQYQPEIHRYGGAYAITANEKLFSLSSSLALVLTKATQKNPAKRYSLALSMMLASLCAYRYELKTIIDFFSAYAGYWQQYSEQTKRLAATELSEPFVEPAHVAMIKSIILRAKANEKTNEPQSIWSHGVQSFVTELSKLQLNGQLCSPMDGQVVVSAPASEGAILNIISSQMHMLNNRLGLTPSQELLLSLKIVKAAKSLQEITDTDDKEQVNESFDFA